MRISLTMPAIDECFQVSLTINLTHTMLFLDLMTKEGYSYDYQYDWLLKKSERLALLGSSPADEEEKEEKVCVWTPNLPIFSNFRRL